MNEREVMSELTKGNDFVVSNLISGRSKGAEAAPCWLHPSRPRADFKANYRILMTNRGILVTNARCLKSVKPDCWRVVTRRAYSFSIFILRSFDFGP